MGCNTSKESVQPVEGEEKGEEQTQHTNQVSQNEHSKRGSAETTDTAKVDSFPNSASVKRFSQTSNNISSPIPAESQPKQEEGSRSPAEGGDSLGDEEAEAAAATKIQAVFRGHQTRRTMKQADKQAAEPEPTREQLEAEFRADDVELCKAATTIQNSFRTHMTRKQNDGGKDGGSAGESSAKQENKDEEELDIDLTDPDLNKAATKIQASFRGHKVRKEFDSDGNGTGADQ